MKENDLYLNVDKCEFFKDSVDFLGLRVSHNKIQMQESKIAGVKGWLVPSKVKELQAF